MSNLKISHLTLLAATFASAAAQDQVEEICYGTESVVAAVIGTLIVTLGLLAAGLFFYRGYWRTREDKHLMLVTDAESPNDQYAFDNPCFREATPIKHNIHEEKQTSRLEKNKWLGWSPLNPFGGKDHKSERVTSLDDSYINDSRLKVVTLKSHDFTGLGFNICGNMRDGIFIKDVLHRGPAFESGCINAGDRIDSVCISFRNMVFEDALAILSYASPYDVQVQVENDSYSRPSTLIRSKRESTISSTDGILHPKYTRSQSITHLNEIGKTNNKRIPHQVDYLYEKNRINHSLNRSYETSNDYPTIKMTTVNADAKKERQRLEKNSAMDAAKKGPVEIHAGKDPQNKHQKFGIKVLPIGVGSGDARTKCTEGQPKPAVIFENEINSKKEKPGSFPSGDVSKKVPNDTDEVDGGKDNVKGMLAKGLQNLKEKINQSSLGRKKGKDPVESDSNVKEIEAKPADEMMNGKVSAFKESPKENISKSEEPQEYPVPKTRSSISREIKPSATVLPEEVSRAGDVARNNRKSLNDPNSCRKSLTSLLADADAEISTNKPNSTRKKSETLSDSENSADGDSLRTTDEAKKPKHGKGKAPAPPGTSSESGKDGKSSFVPKQKPDISFGEVNEIKKDPETNLKKNEKLNEPASQIISLKDEKTDKLEESSHVPGYDSDSDAELGNSKPKLRPNNTTIELTSTQVTVHQSPSGDGNDDEIEPSRKAASLGDLSKLDSEQPLSIVLERAVSLDLADGTSQGSKKRKAPLPPSEEFPAVFDDYRKEPRLEHSLGLNTFQRRLKKSSDFGTMEDALNDGPKSLDTEINKRDFPVDLTETHNSNIQEFSSWLAECRRPKSACYSEPAGEGSVLHSRVSTTSLVNIGSPENPEKDSLSDKKYQVSNVSFSVNGKNFPEMQAISCEEQNVNFPGSTSKTVVLISQPNSLEPGIVEAVPVNVVSEDDNHLATDEEIAGNGRPSSSLSEEMNNTSLERYVTATESFYKGSESGVNGEEDSVTPKLPDSSAPVMSSSNTMSSPLTSSLTYITEIKVSTGQKKSPANSPKEPDFASPEIETPTLKTSTPKLETGSTISKRIQQFSVKSAPMAPVISPIKTKPNFGFSELKNGSSGYGSLGRKDHFISNESSKIPIKMKSETGQKVLATIQSLASKDSSLTRIPEVEYAKKVASLFSGNSLERNKANLRKKPSENDLTSQMNVSGFYLRGPETNPPKPSKDFSVSRKIPPSVPPRKLETSLSSRSTLTAEPGPVSVHSSSSGDKSESKESQESSRNVVTFSSFIPKSQSEESSNSTLISFKIK